jgi:phosphate-selective porin OprO/OprP
MKLKITATAILATALFAQGASAKTLEDVLKEKGVITEEDYKEVTKVKPFDYKLGKGFTLTTPDEKFQLALGSQMQLRYTLLDLDNANNTAAKQAQDSSKFELRRIKLYANGYAFTKDLTYKLTVNFANINNNTTSNGGLLEETYINYRLIDELQFRFGQDKVPFGRQFITPSANNKFVDASTVTNAFVPGYDTGININGKIAGGIFNYCIGGYGGVGQNTFRSTSDNAFAARVTVNPLGEMSYSESDVENSKKPLLSIGANFFRDTLNGTESNNLYFTKTTATSPGWFFLGRGLSPAARQISTAEAVDFNVGGFDAAFKWLGFSAQGEYFIAQADGQSSKNIARGQGYYLQAGYFVIPEYLEIAARYSYTDPNRDVANDHWVEATGGVSWYINKHNLKIQADYTNIHRQKLVASTNPGASAKATDDQQARVQAQILF